MGDRVIGPKPRSNRSERGSDSDRQHPVACRMTRNPPLPALRHERHHGEGCRGSNQQPNDKMNEDRVSVGLQVYNCVQHYLLLPITFFKRLIPQTQTGDERHTVRILPFCTSNICCQLFT